MTTSLTQVLSLEDFLKLPYLIAIFGGFSGMGIRGWGRNPKAHA
nr:hypothetical protein [Pleurocapsa sp. PCC 7327]